MSQNLITILAGFANQLHAWWCQLNALFRLNNYLNFQQKNCTYKSMKKIDSIQNKALQLLYKDFGSNYSQLLDKAKKSTMTVVRLRCLCLEIYKTINRLNLAFMPVIFKLLDSKKPVRKQNALNLNVTKWGTVREV